MEGGVQPALILTESLHWDGEEFPVATNCWGGWDGGHSKNTPSALGHDGVSVGCGHSLREYIFPGSAHSESKVKRSVNFRLFEKKL